MTDVLISVSSSQNGEQNIKYDVSGRYIFTESDTRISYLEPESSEMGITKTRIQITPETVIIRREGNVSGKITLKAGARIPFLYKTPYGVMEMAAEALSMTACLSKFGGTLSLEYDIFINGEKTGKNKLLLKISKM